MEDRIGGRKCLSIKEVFLFVQKSLDVYRYNDKIIIDNLIIGNDFFMWRKNVCTRYKY